MESNPALGLLGFWMLLQLFATLALVLGGVYVMFCLGRAASGLDRMASAMEEWVAQQNAPSQAAIPPHATAASVPLPAAPVSTAAPVESRPEPSPTDESYR